MQIRTFAATLAGAVAIYVVMAACGSGTGADGIGPASSSSSGAEASSSGASSSAGGEENIVDALIDRLTNPVPDAKAAPPDVAVETCSKTYMAGTIVIAYAEHSYPGKLVNELSAVRVVGHTATPLGVPGPYSDIVSTPLVRDGAVAITCGTQANSSYDRVTFILP